MSSMYRRPSSLGASQPEPAERLPRQLSQMPPWALAERPSRSRLPRGLSGRADSPPHGRMRAAPRGHAQAAWPTTTPPGSGTPTYAPGDSAPSTGSLPAISGGLIRRQGTFASRITRDGSSEFPAEPARYQLYASLGCPWSQRALIACRLLGLDRVIGLTLTEPDADERGWRFSNDGDPLTGASLLSDLYRATDPTYPGPYTLPLIWDLRSRRVVTNDVAQINIMLETEFRPFHLPGAPDLYPAARRREIDSLATLIFHTLNTGVYKAGLAGSQASYDQAVQAVFTTLDALDERLARRRFLLGDFITEADVRLYPTLARFDTIYYQKFTCNLRRLVDYHYLWGYTRDLYAHPGFGETTDLGQIKRHYYQSAEWNDLGASGCRAGIVPVGPEIDWNEPHGRARMSG